MRTAARRRPRRLRGRDHADPRSPAARASDVEIGWRRSARVTSREKARCNFGSSMGRLSGGPRPMQPGAQTRVKVYLTQRARSVLSPFGGGVAIISTRYAARDREEIPS